MLTTLARGGSVMLAAKRAGVGRSTIYKWLKVGHPFQQRLAQWKQDIVATARTRMLILAEGATEVIQEAINHGDVRVALKVVVGLGILAPPPVGPTSEQLRAEKLRLDNQSQQRSNAAQAEAEKFLNGLAMEEAPQNSSFVDQRSIAKEEPPHTRNPAA